MKHILTALILVGATTSGVIACGGDNAITRTIDCGQICSTYSDCVTDIDVTACTSECEDRADANSQIADAAQACEQCLDDKSCAEAEPCWQDCPVVPAQD